MLTASSNRCLENVKKYIQNTTKSQNNLWE